MADQYNDDKEFAYKKPRKSSPEVEELKKVNKELVKRLNNCEGRLAAMINDNRTQRKNMIALQENMKTLQRDFDRTTNEVRKINRLIELILREEQGDHRGDR